MSKNHHRRKFVGKMKQANDHKMYSAEWTAGHAKRAMDYLAPLIRAKNMPPTEAIVLTAMTMNSNIKGGGDQWVTEDDLKKICLMILATWENGLFSPCSTYPHSLEQTLAAWGDGEEE